MTSSSSTSTTNGGYPDLEDQTHCPACDKLFNFPEAPRLHYQYSDCKFLYCPLCRIAFPNPASIDDHRRSVHGSLFCSGCATWYPDVDAERWKHKGRCFGGAGFGFAGAAQAGGGAKQCRGSKGEEEEKKEKDEKKGQKRSESGKKGDQWSQARSSSGNQRKQKQSSNSRYHSNNNNNTSEHEEPQQQRSEDHSNSAGIKSLERPSDLYERLGVHPLSSNTQIAHAAKKKRIEVHPDRLQKPGMTERELQDIDEIAKDVGYAADVLQDADKRRKYDRERREHNQQKTRNRC